MRKYTSSQRAPARASMTTEYQDRFLPPHCHMAIVSTTTQKNPYHSLKGTSADITTFRSYYVTHKWIKNPPKAAQPKAPQSSLPPKVQQRCSSVPHNPTRFVSTQLASKVEDYTSVYKNDFRAWKTNTHQPFRLNGSLKVNQGLGFTDYPSEEVHSQKDSAQVEANSKPVPQKKELQPFESITSYRSDYVTHPLPQKTRKEKPVNQTNKASPLDPAASFRPKVAWDINQQLFDGASDFFKHFNTWSLETKFHGHSKAQVSSPPADNNKFLSTTHAHYIPHKCQRIKPILPATHNTEKSKEPFQALTTMREHYIAWETPRPVHVRKEEKDWRKTPFAVCGPTPAQSCKANSKPCSRHPTMNETTVCNSSCNATEKPRAENQAFSGFQRTSSGNEESTMYWSTCLDRGVNLPDGDNCEEPSQAHQIISCMVSSRS